MDPGGGAHGPIGGGGGGVAGAHFTRLQGLGTRCGKHKCYFFLKAGVLLLRSIHYPDDFMRPP